MNWKDIALSPDMYNLLVEIGKMDHAAGTSMYQGWQNCAVDGGFDPHMRTPAREAYEDGYYTPLSTQDLRA